MSDPLETAARALDYIKRLKIRADVDPGDRKTLRFSRNPEIPESFSEEIRTTLDICIEYHQRSVFTGEYINNDPHPPGYRSNDSLDEINFYLDYYKDRLVKEVEKGLDIQEPVFDDEQPKRKMTPFVEAMLRHRALQKKKKE